uniref:Nuclear receptor domain-containing protein n=1 Tax=Panagrolaimus sp. PS1159 TaxID=55785 RepID=A0AC35GUW9_9BILA
MDDQHCRVCEQQGHGLHFGIIACRACSSFFRRSVAERKSYKCRMKESCLIKKGFRNACRACRFKKCLQAGMKVDTAKPSSSLHFIGESTSSGTNIGSIESFSSPSSISPVSTNVEQVVPRDWRQRECKTLYELTQAIHNYKTSEKSLFTVNHTEQIFSPIQYKPVNDDIYKNLFKSSIFLTISMLNDFFRPFKYFSAEEKKEVLKGFYHGFHVLYQSWQTSKIFQLTEDKFFIHYGYYITSDSKDFFPKKEQAEQAQGIFNPILHKMRQCSEKVRKMELIESDLAFIMGVLFCESADNLNIVNDGLTQFQNDLFADYNTYNVLTYGVENGGIRIGKMMSLLLFIKSFTFSLSESMAVAKIFIPDYNDHWQLAMGT